MTEAMTVAEVLHSKLGASSAYRWLNCPGSPQLIRKLPTDAIKSSEAAAQGTAAHEIAAAVLSNNLPSVEQFENVIVKVDKREVRVDKEMVAGVTEYVTFIRDTLKRYHNQGAYLLVEQSLSSEFHPDAFGTSDAVIVVPNDRIIVTDLKYGAGIVVEPNTPQTKYYAYLVIENLPFDVLKGITDVELVISQPRIPHPKGINRSWPTTVDSLGEWFHNEIIPAMIATTSPTAHLDPGPWCKFCPVKPSCPARQNVVDTFDATANPQHMTLEQLNDYLCKGAIIEEQISLARQLALQKAEAGSKFRDFKLVEKQSKRAYREGVETAAEKEFGEFAYEPAKLRSPAQLEEKFGAEGKKFTKTWAFMPSTGYTLAPRSDKRQEVIPLVMLAAQQQKI